MPFCWRLRPQMDEAQRFVVDALGHPSVHARAMAIDAVHITCSTKPPISLKQDCR
jgi:hypothetical protein